MTKHIEEMVDEIVTMTGNAYKSGYKVNKDWLREKITQAQATAREEERERCIEVVKKSRTLWEGLGVGKNQDDARTQAIIDLQTLNNKTDV